MDVQKKCPNCGALIPSLSLRCVDCGYSFGKESESSEIAREAIERLQSMLKDIDQNNAKISKKKRSRAIATIITTFAVPNTKEAMISFLILAYSNIESSSETKDRDITMAWEARAISTYNLLKLQQDSDPQIEYVLQKYSILEDSKKLAKIDGRAKRKAKKRRVVICLVFILALFSVPFVVDFINKQNYDPILVAIEEGRYDEAIERINNDAKLKNSVEFYIDKFATLPIAMRTSQVSIDSIIGCRTVNHLMNDGGRWVWKMNYENYDKDVELMVINPDSSVKFHIIDSLNLSEKLWSIQRGLTPFSDNILDLYFADTLGIHLDSLGRCDTLTYAYGRDTTICCFKFDDQNLIIQQDIFSGRDTTHISTTATYNDGSYLFVDMTDGLIPIFISRNFDSRHRLMNFSKKWSIMETTYDIREEQRNDHNRLQVDIDKSIPRDKLAAFDFEAEMVVISKTIWDNLSGKGVLLDYTNVVKENITNQVESNAERDVEMN